MMKSKIPVWMETCGARIALREDPFCVAVMTPIMSRTHLAECSAGVCFVDSTASCDADNHVITFLLTATPAGAVPVGFIITDSASQVSYTAGFRLLQSILPTPSFGGTNYPHVFITDDSDAERNAINTCWPESVLRLCFTFCRQFGAGCGLISTE
jgi:hypothetical protein